MKAFDQLQHVVDSLLGPEGCPWDKKQTLLSLRGYLLEEAHEVVDAIDLDAGDKIREELGDLFLIACLLCRVLEKEKNIAMVEVLETVVEKLVRRHPHVFGDKKVLGVEAIRGQWENIKDEENDGERQEKPFEGIPRALPALSKAQKVLKRLERMGVSKASEESTFTSEEEVAETLWSVIARAQASGFDAELALNTMITEKMNHGD